jgi:YidC/Oxa1 family membrane protein insertase
MSLLTKSTTFIIGPVATILGYVMNGIFWVLDKIGIPNIALAIILFTIVIYMLMLPLTYRQQKFSRMTPLMNPELNAIRDKYKGRTDQESMARMNEETQMVYAKYGVNPAGSCVQLVIQMIILFPLYRVIMNIPAYVGLVKNVFTGLAESLLNTAGAEDFLKSIATSIQATTISKEFSLNTIIDTLYKFRPQNWTALAEQFPDLSAQIDTTHTTIDRMNNFLGLNIADTPMNIITARTSVLLVIMAVLVPVLAALSQWISVKISMAGTQQPEGTDQMAASMKTMNNVMPLMSAFFCLTLPVGMGIYWIMSAVVRTVQQFFINKALDKTDMEALLQANIEKNKKKMEKKGGVTGAQIYQNTSINTRNIDPQAQARRDRARSIQKEAQNIDDSAVTAKKNVRPGSLAEKANMVSDYNEKHRKK